MLSIFFLALSVVLTKAFCIFAQNSYLLDKPKDRSMHSKATLRGGGLIFISLSLVAFLIVCSIQHRFFFDQLIFIVAVVLLAGVSFLDDLYHLSVRIRFLVQSIVALLIALFMSPEVLNFEFFRITHPLLVGLFIFFTVIWAINHFNFMDGLDGFCALQAIFILAAYAMLFRMSDALAYQDFCLIVLFILGGFLMFNLPPAKLFMGDVGSATLGLITFCLAVIAQKKYQLPILYWFMLNGLFLFDATLTLLRRIIHREAYTAAHKKHAYQRLRLSGISMFMILSGQMLMNFSFLILVLLLHAHVFGFGLLVFQLSFMSLIYYLIEKRRPMFRSLIC